MLFSQSFRLPHKVLTPMTDSLKVSTSRINHCDQWEGEEVRAKWEQSRGMTWNPAFSRALSLLVSLEGTVRMLRHRLD